MVSPKPLFLLHCEGFVPQVMLKFFITAFLFLPCLVKAQTGNISFERVSSHKWLYQRNISSIAQDAEGYIWFGTSNGLYRFDGYTVDEYRYNAHNLNSLPHNNVNCIYASPDSTLWIGTWGGLARFDPKNGIFTRYTNQPGVTNSLPINDVRAIAKDPGGNIWLGTFGAGLVKFNPISGTFKQFSHDRNDAGSLSSNFVNALILDKAGDIWVGTRRGINKLETQYERFTQFPGPKETRDELMLSNVSTLFEDAAGDIWFGTFGGGLALLDRKNATIRRFTSQHSEFGQLASNTITSISENEKGKIWVGTPEGLHIIEKFSGEVNLIQSSPSLPNSLINNDIRTIYPDRSGAIWIITSEGINIYSRLSGRFRKYQRIPGSEHTLLSNKVNCFAEDKAGNVWIGTQGGLNRFERYNKRFTSYKLGTATEDNVAGNDIKSLLIDQKGIYWVGTAAGLYKFDPESGTSVIYKVKQGLQGGLQNEVHTLYQTRTGEIWVGLRQGLARFLPDSGVFVIYKPVPGARENQITNNVYTLLEDRYGKFWVGTLGGGLFEFDRSKKRFRKYANEPSDSTSLSHNSVISLHEDRFGFFWVGTYGGGLNRMDRKTGQFTHYTAQTGLQDDMIYSILEDPRGNLWISTNKGLVKFETRTKKFRNYDALDGLQTNEFNIGSALVTRSNEMFFGGNAGFNLFHPEQIIENNYIPPTVITHFKVFENQVLLRDSSIQLAYNKNYITFEFSSLSYALSDKNQFAYKMEGFDSEWIYSSSRRFASYSNLSPGHYTFRVISSNSDGVWNETGKTIHVYIERPFWSTWWFILLCVFLVAASLYIGHRIRIHNIHKQKVLLEEMVLRRTYELEKATNDAENARQSAEKASRSKSSFLANMSHEIRTPLNGILGFTDLLMRGIKNEENKRYLELIRSSGDTLLRLLSDILDLNKIEQGKLSIEHIQFNFIETIQRTLIPYQYRANEKGLQFMMSFDTRIPDLLSGDPTRIKQLIINLVSNAIKFTDSGGIAIQFEAETDPRNTESYFYISGKVIDTGIGVPADKQNIIFDTFTQADGTFTRKYGGSGLGLSIVKQLIRLMDGDIKITSPIIDKPFSSNEPGSCFEFRFRVKAEKAIQNDQSGTKENTNEPCERFKEPYKILLVEDNKINQLLAVTVLENLGLTVSTADDGALGVEKVKAEDFDLILMDVQMPVMNGYESTAAMRNLGIGIPIIGLTANVYKEDIDRCFDAGMNSHLGKPFTEKDLFTELKRWLL